MPNRAHELTANKYSAQRMVSGSEEHAGHIPALDTPFLIPIYQRLYTWETQHVECLLQDVWEAYQQQSDTEYFIGAVVVSPIDDGRLELIDGQQRMTTLWLIASVLVTAPLGLSLDSLPKWRSFMAVGAKQPPVARLDFSGREQDKQALAAFMRNWGCDCGCASSTECNGWLKNEAMVVARKTIINFFNRLANQPQQEEGMTGAGRVQAFSDYLWAKATFVVTKLHQETDKNRFFDSMNSRGVQLEKHEILKARLLNQLPEVERRVYAWAWDLCADIDGYVKNSLQAELDYGRSAHHIGSHLLSKVTTRSEGGTDSLVEGSRTLAHILSTPNAKANTVDTDEELSTKYKSFVSFPVFLLHVLRVFVGNSTPSSDHAGVSVDHKKLLAEFDKHFPSNLEHQHKPFGDKTQCKAFIHCLLRCRLLMDNFMIKGHVHESSHVATRWEIASPLAEASKNNQRTKRTGQHWDSISMLQSMMYFSQDLTRVPWLTEALKALYEPGAQLDDAKNVLNGLTQQDARYAQTVARGKSLQEILGVGDTFALCDGLGTDTPHYWFYKLEYLLWECWFNADDPDNKPVRPEILKGSATIFRMRHVTSVEHVSPQSKNTGEITQLDRFGNLALLSVGENSTYSDKDPVEKKGMFRAGLNKGIIQSLKLADIFSSINDDSDWCDTAMKKHETAMAAVLLDAHPELAQGATQ